MHKSNTKYKGGDITAILAPGLPNITGWFAIDCDSPRPEGAFYRGNDIDSINVSHGGTTDQKCMFDASRSNAIYGTSSTVQPPSICLIPQIKY